MKWLKPKECGLSKTAHVSHVHDGGFMINRLPDYWVQRVLRKIAGPSQFPAGLKLQFRTDSTRLVLKYSCGRIIGPLIQKIIILVDQYQLEYKVESGKEPVEFLVNLHVKSTKLVQIHFPWGAEIVLHGIGVDDQAVLSPDHDNRRTICFCGDSITQGFMLQVRSILTHTWSARAPRYSLSITATMGWLFPIRPWRFISLKKCHGISLSGDRSQCLSVRAAGGSRIRKVVPGVFGYYPAL